MNWATTNTEVASTITHTPRALNSIRRSHQCMVCDSLESRTNSREGGPCNMHAAGFGEWKPSFSLGYSLC